MARIAALTPQIDLASRRGTFRFRSRLRRPLGWTLAVDLYSHLRESHPETHLGYWVFTLPEGRPRTQDRPHFTKVRLGLERAATATGADAESWSNPE